MAIKLSRCSWCLNDSDYIDYHDNEWGVPEFDDKKLFEMLILESAQAGLSWITILKKRKFYQSAYKNFDPVKVAKFTHSYQSELTQEGSGIVKNKLKIKCSVQNAKVFLEIQKSHNSFSDYLWALVGHNQIVNHFETIQDIPTETEVSKSISKDLKTRGMKFVGPTIIYAYMQSVGLVNDHVTSCFRHPSNICKQ